MIFTLKDQNNFAELSKDFNPMHCDEILARRYIYGEPIVHGINAMLFAIREWSAKSNKKFYISKLRCKFTKAVFLNSKVSFKFKNINNSIKISLIQNDEIKMRILMEVKGSKYQNIKIRQNDLEINTVPNDISFDKLIDFKETINFSTNLKHAEKYYSKDFVDNIGFNQLSEIIAYSRIVGMHAPGLNSIFSELNLFENRFTSDDISFKVISVDDRFNIINIESQGPSFKSNIKAFYRPLQVNQKKIEDLKEHLIPNEFKDFRALIIGASRGLGELTAKCLGHGGASLMLTYSKGKSDILNVIDDIKKYNKNVSTFQLDVTKTEDINFKIIEEFKPTHVFYYATPFIFGGTRNKFSKELYKKFKIFYYEAFEVIIKKLERLNTDIYYLYPSSSAVQDKPDDMVEYSLAKKEGEELCSNLESKYSNVKIFYPRLPRLETDQTVSLSSVKNEDPIQILDIIRLMNSKDLTS